MSGKGAPPTHGLSKTAEYKVWQMMKDRCLNENSTGYANYGGRGIKVCDRWLSGFAPFFEDMGRRPGPGFSIERIDNDGNYEPSNCRWASRREQNNNSRNCRFITWRGETHTVVGWASKLGLSTRALRVRLHKGWPIDDVLSFHTNDAFLTRSKRNGAAVITHNGITQTVAYWARVTGVKRTTIRYRLESGWSVADALSAQPDHGRKYAK